MPAQALSASIQAALNNFDVRQFRASNLALLNALGYSSDRTQAIPGADPQAFRAIVESHSGKTLNADKAKFADWKQADLLFQFTDEELSRHRGLFQDAAINASLTRSYLFFAVELSGTKYSRTDLATIARQINRLFPMPVMVTFSYANKLSMAVINRRPHKRDESRDVLGHVSLIRDIDLSKPHRAHLDVLQALSLPNRLKWADDHNKPRNFDGLLAAWLAVLDTEELNRQFYKDLFAWFERAVTTARFPTDEAKTLPPEEHVIRLITRLLFIWFIKEKGLIADDLFNETQVAGLLKHYDPDTGDSYYRAVLQNLFFATLNTEINKRGFSKETHTTHRDFSRCRYKAEMCDPDKLVALFRRTPFINGGLFDCLDTEAATRDGGWRIDCFTDNPRSRSGYSIPNRLFFSRDKNNPGLITLFDKYKFTVEENTPAEQEVALDPELLGKVFENLLAAYNPETRDTARKQTGSYYTPRAIVDYMVDEALTAYLSETATPTPGPQRLPRATGHGSRATGHAPTTPWQQRIRCLLDYTDPFDDAEQLFTPTERDHIIQAIAEIKVLDPAVGSGAFPMGILHKLTLALRRLDPDNTRWETLQKDLAGQKAASAFNTQNQQDRDAELNEISTTFERYRDSDFGRKLYLIQNSIYGVDVQPVASQIAKLRFFISLAIEQEPTGEVKDNYGIKPLPNLETRFVAANALIGLQLDTAKTFLYDDDVQCERNEIAKLRDKHFLASNRRQKLELIRQEEQHRNQLKHKIEKLREQWNTTQSREIDRKVNLLPNPKHRDQLRKEEERKYEEEKTKFNAGLADAQKIAEWDPLNQNAEAADWFDAEWMFGVTKGFDVVIGNPPYVESRNSLLSNELKDSYGNQVLNDWKKTLPRGSDLLIYFYARSPKLIKNSGYGCFITQNAWLSTDYGKTFQRFSIGKFSFQKIIDTSAKFFSDTKSQNINAVITLFTKKSLQTIEYGVADRDMTVALKRNIEAKQTMKWGHLFCMPQFFEDILLKMSADVGIGDTIAFGQGLNFPKNELNRRGASVPIIVKDSRFVAVSADGRIHRASGRENKIPALILPRGVGDRHYCTFNLCKAFSYSHVELYLPDDLYNSEKHYCLWLYLNSSFVWLFREITGRKNLGGGLLKAEATDMKALPVDFEFDFAKDAKKVFDGIKNREPMRVSEEIHTKEHLFIDEIVADYFGFTDMKKNIRETLIEQVAFRVSRARIQDDSNLDQQGR